MCTERGRCGNARKNAPIFCDANAGTKRCLGNKIFSRYGFFFASFSLSRDRLQVTRGYKSHSWVFCWILVVFILLVIMLISRNNQSFTSYSAENFCENLNLAAESYPQSEWRKPRLFCLNAIIKANGRTNLFWMKSR